MKARDSRSKASPSPNSARLFVYGTLRDPDLLAKFARRAVRFVPATLDGWRRVALRDGRYPTLTRANGRVEGFVAVVTRATLTRLAAYEGPSYRLMPIVVQTARGNLAARAWIAPGGGRRAWP